MVSYKKLRINISEIRQNGVLCANPTVVWITQEGTINPCIGEDYIEIEAPASDEGCIELVVQCSDCDVCPPIHINRCICTTSSDCADCEECVGGFCVPLCPDTLCINDTCVDCIDDDDCPDNLICSGGKCVCPPSMPFQNDKGECVSCLTDSNCPKCTYCLGGECVPLECGDGVCDPTTGECEECINNGNCGTNECCVNNDCVCCEGFHWDYNLNLCVPDPECFTEDDCAVCESCVGGNCVEIPLRDGYIAIEENGECIIVKTCPCGSNDCPQGYTCISYDGNTCICVQCEGVCTSNDDCGEGCFCGGSGICLPSPCHGSCENGADCGEGCGCLNGECVPCSSIDCSTNPTACAEIIGCECAGNTCTKIGSECTGGCQNVFDCGEGCTCYNGECVPCGYFSCENRDCDDMAGCMCTEGTCGDDPSDRVCNDTLTLTKTNCDLTAQLSGISDCPCPKITADLRMLSVVDLAGSTPALPSYRANFIVELRKGEGHPLTLPLLTDNHPDIAENEVPNVGSLILSISETYVNKTTGINEGGATVGVYTVDMSGKSYENLTNIDINKIGSTAGINSNWKIDTIVLELRVGTYFDFPNNCDYAATVIGSKTIDSSTIINNTQSIKDNFTIYKALSSPDTRYPRLTWYKSATNVFSASNIFRSLYVPLSVGGYIDTLYGMDEIPVPGLYPLSGEQGELWNNYYYMVKADCSCVAEGSLGGKLYFCDPDDFSGVYTLDDCNRTISLLDFVPCDMNGDLPISTGTYSVPNSTQTKYELLINGVLWHTFVYDDGVGGMVTYDTGTAMNGMTKTYTNETITSVTWRIYHTLGDYVCTQTYTHSNLLTDDIVILSTDCQRGDYYTVYVDETQTGGTITDITITSIYGGTVIYNSGIWEIQLDKHYVHTLLVSVDIGGSNECKKVLTLPIPNCNMTATLVMSDITCGGTLDLSTSTTGDTPPNTYLYSVPNPTPGGAPLLFTTETVSLAEGDYGNGQVTVDVTDSMGNTAQGSGNASRQTYSFNYPTSISVCAGETYDIVLTGTIGADVATNIPGHGTVTLPETITLTAVADATYTYSTLTPASGGCVFTLTDMETNVDVLSQPVATMVSPANPSCSISNPAVTITGGTPNATVYYTLDGIAATKILDGAGNGSILLPLSEGVHTIVKTKVKLGTCENTTGQSLSVTVNVSPTINIYPNSYECSADLSTYEVQFSCISSNLSATDGIITSIGANLYRLASIPTGVASTITAINGVCTTTAITTAYACDCGNITVTPPVPIYPGGQTSYYWCDNDPVIPTLVVNSGDEVDWYSAMSGGALLLNNSLTYTPGSLPVAGSLVETSVFYAEAVDANGCVSSPRTPVTITRFQSPNIDIYKSGSDYLCEGTKVTFYSNVYGGDSPYSYTWSLDTLNCPNCYIDGANDGATVVIGMGDTGDTFDLTLTIQDSSLNNCTTDYTYSGVVGSDCPVVPFILKIDTTEPGTATNQFQLTGAQGTYDVTAIKFGQTTIQEFTGLTDQNTLTFTQGSGVYDLRIYPTGGVSAFHRINFFNGGDKAKVLEVVQWGDVEWSSMAFAFQGCSNLTTVDAVSPDLSSCTNLTGMFMSCSLLATPNLTAWDVSNITIMRDMFSYATIFNGNITGWDVSNVVNMNGMFAVTTAFNQNIGAWDVSNVTDMSYMFNGATAFNQDIDSWDVSLVTDMESMFSGATAFNQSLASWELNAAIILTDFLKGTTALTCANYSATLVGISGNVATPTGRIMGASGADYGTDAADARAHLVSATGLQWTVTGDVGTTGTCLVP